MQNISSLFIFIFGLLFGSFLNVVIFWLESADQETGELGKQKKRENILGRSFCPSCKHQLNFLDLIPVLSWVILKGKCRYCKEKISVQYPLVELFTGLMFLTTFLYLGGEDFSAIGLTKLLLLLIVNCLLLIVFVYDLKHKIIPDRIILPSILLAFSYLLFAVWGGGLSFNSFLLTLVSAIVAGGFFYALAAVSDGKWMGGGDIKLAFLMGLILGFPNILVGLFLGFILGSIFGVSLIAMRKAKLQSEIPFGPFLITGTWVALFWGYKIVQWYMRAFM